MKRTTLSLIALTTLAVTLSVTAAITSPTDIAGLKTWHTADQGVTTSGGAVTAWADQSGNGWDAVVPSTEDASNNSFTGPAVINNAVFGKPVLQFAAESNDLLGVADVFGSTDGFHESAPDIERSTSDFTIAAVYRTALTDTRPTGFGSKHVADGSNDADPRRVNLATDPSLRFDGAAITGHTASHPSDEVFVRIVTADNTSGSTFSFAEYWTTLSGGVPTTSQVLTATTVDLNVGFTDDLYFGAVLRTLSLGDNVEIGEVIIYDSVLGSTDRQDVADYLAGRWLVPEPASLALLALGGLLILPGRRGG